VKGRGRKGVGAGAGRGRRRGRGEDVLVDGEAGVDDGGKGVETGGEGGLGLMAGRKAARMRGGGIFGGVFLAGLGRIVAGRPQLGT
jgi:hypothetical protein